MNPVLASVAIATLFLILLVLERWMPLRPARHSPLRRIAVNLMISVLAIGTAFALVRPAAGTAIQQAEALRFGLLYWIQLPRPFSVVAGLLLLDLSFYFWHLANHRVPLLWRLHVVHHIDPDLDVSTAFRFHFGEVALSAGFRVVQILLIGASPLTFAIYEILFQANTLFQHSNVRLPISLERVLSYALVTPRMHGIHHSTVQRETTSNFSVVFSCWDRLHRTLRLNVPQQGIVIGIPAYAAPADNAIGALLRLPFHTQRYAWRQANGERVIRDEALVATSQTCLAA